MVQLRYTAVLALLALVPMAVYVADRGESVVALSAVSVVLIAASLYLVFGPASGDDIATSA